MQIFILHVHAVRIHIDKLILHTITDMSISVDYIRVDLGTTNIHLS